MTEEQIQRAVESIYENESLTEELDDDAAEALLQWGEQQVRRLGEQMFDEAAFEQSVFFVRRLMSNMNYFVGQRENMDDEEARQMMAEIIHTAQTLSYPLSTEAIDIHLATEPQGELYDQLQELLTLIDPSS